MANKEAMTSPEVLEEIEKRAGNTDEPKLQKVRRKKQVNKRSVLPPVQASSSKETQGRGVSTGSKVSNSKRVSGGKSKKVSDNTLRKSISSFMKTIIHEVDPDSGCTYAESIARNMVIRAAANDKAAMEFVRDSTEGKPSQAPKNQDPIEEVEGELQKSEISLINSLLG